MTLGPHHAEDDGALLTMRASDSADKQSRVRPVSPGSADDALICALYAEHGRLLLGYAYRLTRDRYLSQDIVQETLLRAWRASDKLSNQRGSIRGWLFTVARNVAVDLARARGARPTEVSADLAGSASTVAVENDHAENVTNSIVVADALGRLSREHRDALIEVYFRGKTASEASVTLGIPIGTVKSRVYHALRALRVSLGEPKEVIA